MNCERTPKCRRLIWEGGSQMVRWLIVIQASRRRMTREVFCYCWPRTSAPSRSKKPTMYA
jgi:hypothetical protein